MIRSYHLGRFLTSYGRGKIDSSLINPLGEQKFNAWVEFLLTLVKINRQKLYPSRFDFMWFDRTNSFPSLPMVNILPHHCVPKGPPISLDLLDICMTRATQLLNMNRHINVMWSGGIDSTLALFSLLRASTNLDQLSVMCTFESILESGSMFDRHLRNSGVRIKFDRTRIDQRQPYSHDIEDPSQIYITGQCGDQLFGPDIRYLGPNIKPDTPWFDHNDRTILDIVAPSIKHSARPIENSRDFVWWLFFNFTWTTVTYDNAINRPNDLGPRIIGFFDDPEFQKWALHTDTYYINDHGPKHPAKTAIKSLVDFDFYINNKRKLCSQTWSKQMNWLYLDANYTTHYLT